MTKNATFADLIGKVTTLSFDDVKIVNDMYNCSGRYKQVRLYTIKEQLHNLKIRSKDQFSQLKIALKMLENGEKRTLYIF